MGRRASRLGEQGGQGSDGWGEAACAACVHNMDHSDDEQCVEVRGWGWDLRGVEL